MPSRKNKFITPEIDKYVNARIERLFKDKEKILTHILNNVSDLLSLPLNSLPLSRIGNSYSFNGNGFNNFSQVNISRRENQTVQLNTSNQIFIELNLASSDFCSSSLICFLFCRKQYIQFLKPFYLSTGFFRMHSLEPLLFCCILCKP